MYQPARRFHRLELVAVHAAGDQQVRPVLVVVVNGALLKFHVLSLMGAILGTIRGEEDR